jgi:hypothetical protein
VNFVETANVRSVFVDGVARTWDGRLAGIDENALRRDGEACRERLMARLGVTDAAMRRGLTARTMPRGGIEG